MRLPGIEQRASLPVDRRIGRVASRARRAGFVVALPPCLGAQRVLLLGAIYGVAPLAHQRRLRAAPLDRTAEIVLGSIGRLRVQQRQFGRACRAERVDGPLCADAARLGQRQRRRPDGE